VVQQFKLCENGPTRQGTLALKQEPPSMPDFTVTMQELYEHQRERDWRRAGIGERDIADSRDLGMHPKDVSIFRECSNTGILLIIRLPKLAARPWQGVMPPKPYWYKKKTGTSGLVADREFNDETGEITGGDAIFVSDYDMMSVWRAEGNGWQKIFISAAGGASRGPWLPESKTLVRELNKRLVSKLQHGCQDDYQVNAARHPNVKQDDRFGFFIRGKIEIHEGFVACGNAYRQNGLDWPYDMHGKYCGPA
jgi:hypothetical protein